MRRIFLPLLAAALPGCALGAIEDYEAAHASEGGSTSGSTGEGATTFSSVTIDPHASAGSTSGGTDAEATGADGSTSDEPTEGPSATPPAIASYTLSTRDGPEDEGDPLVITKHGPIFVDVDATDADGVRVEFYDGAVIELAAEVEGVFRGDFLVVSALANGGHVAKLVPYREDYGDGEAAAAPYAVALPPMGAELLWDADQKLGWGLVVDVEVLPDGDILELLSLIGDDFERTCALRRRNPQGVFDLNHDVELLLNGEPCEAVDLAVRDGQVFILLTDDDGQWSLEHTPLFSEEKASILPVAKGEPGETATALALHEDGGIAVCGTVPSGFGDDDAFAWVWESGKEPTRQMFDYVLEGEDFPEEPHMFDETPRDCVFVGEDRLVLVGEAHGKHDQDDNTFYRRRFVLPVDLTKGDPPNFLVAAGEGSGNAMQSVATSADVDDLGRLLLAGYTCDKECKNVEGRLWVQSLDGTLNWFAQLGLFGEPYLAPSGVRWHPAGYVVVANGGTLKEEDTFMLRAFALGEYEPLWTFAKGALVEEHYALALTVGPYGEICASGIGDGFYPGLACVGG